MRVCPYVKPSQGKNIARVLGAVKPLPIIPARWQVAVKAATTAQYAIVKHWLTQATERVIAADADREGEMIGQELVGPCG
jgi:DNA topoisomerase-3